MTMAQAKEKGVHLAQSKQYGVLWSFLASHDGAQLLNDKTVRKSALKSVDQFFADVKAGVRTSSPEVQLAALQLKHDINAMNHFEENYTMSGPFMFAKNTLHLKR
jgi:hypothetical protein